MTRKYKRAPSFGPTQFCTIINNNRIAEEWVQIYVKFKERKKQNESNKHAEDAVC